MARRDTRKKRDRKSRKSDYWFYGLISVVLFALVYVMWSGSQETEAVPTTTTTTIKPAYGFCSDPRPEICISLYEPVCGDNGITYGNSCVACTNPDVVTWTSGACLRHLAVYYRSGCFNETDGAAGEC